MNFDQNNTAKIIIDKMSEIPSMPAVVGRAISLLDNPDTDVKQLADVISMDISMTTQILKLVNSAYYGFPSQIASINKAMALLGFDKIRSLIMSVAVKPMMMCHSGKGLWNHSIRCAVATQYIAKSLKHGDPDEAFIMGLLHDIGKTIMQSHSKNAFAEVQKLVDIGADVFDAERTFFGFTHTEAGKIMVSKWNLPLIISITAEHHHNPAKAEEPVSSGIVYVADRITQEQLKYPIFEPEIIESFDFEIEDPEALREEIFELSQPIIQALS